LLANIKAAIVHQAKQKEANYITSRPSRRATADGAPAYWWTAQNVHRTMVAHSIASGADKQMLFKALLLEADWGLGRNSDNIILMSTSTTPLDGRKNTAELYSTGRDDGAPGMHPGQTGYLNHDNWYCGMAMGCPSTLYENAYPNFLQEWPKSDGYFSSRYHWAHTEFTPRQTMRGKMALYGYLAGLGTPDPVVSVRKKDANVHVPSSGLHAFSLGSLQLVKDQKYSVAIVSLAGRVVWQQRRVAAEKVASSLRLPSLARGVYVVQLQSPVHTATTQLIRK